VCLAEKQPINMLKTVGLFLLFIREGNGAKRKKPLPWLSEEVVGGENYICYSSVLLCELICVSVQLPFPIIIAREGKWFVASCPLLDIATQGKSEEEVKANMVDLIDDYLSDPDTPKPALEDLMSLSLANIAVKVPEGVLHAKASTAASKKSN
jgi:predicted RNase H-like HicB family nuclease